MRISTKLLMNAKYYDVVIAGGGMVGSVMACACAAYPRLQKKSVLLLEAGTGLQSSNAVSSLAGGKRIYSNRVSAINPGSKKFFERIGVWPHIISDGQFKTVKQLTVWDACSTSKIHFEYENFARDVAYIIENNKIVDSCTKMLDIGSTSKNNVTVKNRSKLAKIRIPDDLQNLVEIELVDGAKFETSLLIGADGVSSSVRSSMGSHYVSWPYNQKAIVATLAINTVGDNSVAWQRFTPNGPVALLPLSETESSLVWTTTPQEVDRLLGLPADQFVDELNRTLWEDTSQSQMTNQILSWFETCAYKFTNVSKADQLPPTVIDVEPTSIAAFPLGFGHSTNYVSNRCALIGDAAHRVHPLAGQGVNLGFGDCLVLADILDELIGEGADIGSLLHLKDYEAKRQVKNLPVMLSLDILNRLYRTEFLPFVMARSAGLSFTNYSAFIKDLIMQQASIH